MASLLEGNSVIALAQGARIGKAKISPLITLMKKHSAVSNQPSAKPLTTKDTKEHKDKSP